MDPQCPPESPPPPLPPPPPAAPVLGVCGFSGSGKTTLVEAAIARLRARGLRVAAVKHTGHDADIDRPGKDSDRLFQSGADIILAGPDQTMLRRRGGREWRLDDYLAALGADHDLVLVEGFKSTPVTKVWLRRDSDESAPADVEGLLAVLEPGPQRTRQFDALLDDWLPIAWRARPLRAGILIGGRSRRMGRPKHLLASGGRTLLARTVAALEGKVRQTLLLGAGDVPVKLNALPRLTDVPDVRGPLAGMLAAMRWAPHTAWIFAACDHPAIDANAIDWLIEQRRPGHWAIMPRRTESDDPEPLLALYEPQCRPAIEALVRQGRAAPRHLAGSEKTARPLVPAALAPAWRGVNTPDEFQQLAQDQAEEKREAQAADSTTAGADRRRAS